MLYIRTCTYIKYGLPNSLNGCDFDYETSIKPHLKLYFISNDNDDDYTISTFFLQKGNSKITRMWA